MNAAPNTLAVVPTTDGSTFVVMTPQDREGARHQFGTVARADAVAVMLLLFLLLPSLETRGQQ